MKKGAEPRVMDARQKIREVSMGLPTLCARPAEAPREVAAPWRGLGGRGGGARAPCVCLLVENLRTEVVLTRHVDGWMDGWMMKS